MALRKTTKKTTVRKTTVRKTPVRKKKAKRTGLLVSIEPESARKFFRAVKKAPYGKRKNTRYVKKIRKGEYLYKTKLRATKKPWSL